MSIDLVSLTGEQRESGEKWEWERQVRGRELEAEAGYKEKVKICFSFGKLLCRVSDQPTLLNYL